MKRCILRVCDALHASEAELNDLDRGSGDADCGSTLKAGADGIYSHWCTPPHTQYTYTMGVDHPHFLSLVRKPGDMVRSWV